MPACKWMPFSHRAPRPQFESVAAEIGIAADDVVLHSTFPRKRFAADSKDQTLAAAGASGFRPARLPTRVTAS